LEFEDNQIILSRREQYLTLAPGVITQENAEYALERVYGMVHDTDYAIYRLSKCSPEMRARWRDTLAEQADIAAKVGLGCLSLINQNKT